ncbi:pyridoxamine 5'-phosphate oxidase family protein [Streptomyces sp. TLI_171]|uniref:pyridoxamine 5'-phosphate oxidase family protein n=1 Tax=Streptomyces sp. TLI_171 TaxID=1938859 RepID=UPI000C17918F|nr:TIGR03618 family F420-dependent PPOX class oxidoreductase [Streptomyces sp. TLI_171]RKE19880.1 PPOX class probable F420-dependent enzyme [Streptomyces sp. TLI_171]
MPTQLRLSPSAEHFLAENHLCTFTTVRPNGTPHVAPVRFTWDPVTCTARVMTVEDRRKARNVIAGGPAAPVSVCQLAGPRWITLEGTAEVHTDPARVLEGMRRYANRYGALPPRVPRMAVIEIAVTKAMGLY